MNDHSLGMRVADAQDSIYRTLKKNKGTQEELEVHKGMSQAQLKDAALEYAKAGIVAFQIWAGTPNY